MGMTIAEKILAKKSGHEAVAPGDLVTVSVDTVVLFDNNFMPSIWRDILKVRAIPSASSSSSTTACRRRRSERRAHIAPARVRREVRHQALSRRRRHQGISHQLVADHGYALPGTVLVCSDSHTCSAGVFNCLARGVGGPDVMYRGDQGRNVVPRRRDHALRTDTASSRRRHGEGRVPADRRHVRRPRRRRTSSSAGPASRGFRSTRARR